MAPSSGVWGVRQRAVLRAALAWFWMDARAEPQLRIVRMQGV